MHTHSTVSQTTTTNNTHPRTNHTQPTNQPETTQQQHNNKQHNNTTTTQQQHNNTTNNIQQTTNNKQQTTNNKQQTTNSKAAATAQIVPSARASQWPLPSVLTTARCARRWQGPWERYELNYTATIRNNLPPAEALPAVRRRARRFPATLPE